LGFTDGIYQEGGGKLPISAEIVLLLPPFGRTIDVTEGEGISQYVTRRIKPNFDFLHSSAGFYAVASGIPVYKFHIPIRSNTNYTKRVITYGDKTEYIIKL
jgi:hypothetical protein